MLEGNNALLHRTVTKWAAVFQRGHVTSRYLKFSGQPVTVWNDVSRAVIHQRMESDKQCLRYREKQAQK